MIVCNWLCLENETNMYLYGFAILTPVVCFQWIQCFCNFLMFFQAVLNSLEHAPQTVRTVINDALVLYGEDIFMTRPVKEMLWGYIDPALKTLNGLFPDWFYTDFVGYFINVGLVVIYSGFTGFFFFLLCSCCYCGFSI